MYLIINTSYKTVMGNRESFVLIKPDGLVNKEMICYMVSKFKENGLEIINKKKVILRCEDVLVMWPAYTRCFIAKKMLINYLANKEVEVWRLKGDNISDTLGRIKKDIRNNYGNSCVANCIHTPSDNEEARWQYAIINKEKIEVNAIKKNVEYHAGLFGKMSDVNEDILERIIDDVMKDYNKDANKQMVANEVDITFNDWAIVSLLDQSNITMDYAASALMEVFDKFYSVKDIIRIIMDVDFYGKRRLLITNYEKACRIKDMLIEKYTLDATVEKIIEL